MWQEAQTFLSKYFDLTLAYVANPSKRIFVLYLLSALVLAFFVYKKTKRNGGFWHYIFHKKVWLGASARIDYGLFFLNGIIKILLIIPYLYFGFRWAFYIEQWMIARWGYVSDPLSPMVSLVLYTIALTLVNDFLVYLVHLAMHKIPFLWEFHKIHHSATTMNPITQYRIHPVELIINNIQSTIAFALTTGIFQYLSDQMVTKWMFLGANVFSFIFFMLGANLRHSHVRFKYHRWVEYLFMSPMQHQIHHSKNRQHWDKNMGSKLAIWDWMFGTLHLSDKVKKIHYGLGARQDFDYQTFWQNIINPFKNNWMRIKDIFISK